MYRSAGSLSHVTPQTYCGTRSVVDTVLFLFSINIWLVESETLQGHRNIRKVKHLAMVLNDLHERTIYPSQT